MKPAKYWPGLLLLQIWRLAASLPYAYRRILGRWVGRLLYRVLRRRRHIARVNIQLCFPTKNEQEREALVVSHFHALGVAVFETGAAWWAPDHRLAPLRVEGEDHLRHALAKGRGVVLLSAHFLSMEMGLRLFSVRQFGYAVYRPHNDPVWNAIILRGRQRVRGEVIDRSDFRRVLKALKANHPVWYPPDQDHGKRYSVFAPFFGQTAATLSATSRLARISQAAIVPFYTHRLPGTDGYLVTMLPPLEDFPSGDDVHDATRINQYLEDQIRRFPEQYLWVHRRFKTRPEGQADVYEQQRP